MKPLQGPTRSGNSEKHISLLGSDAEEWVEEDFERPPLIALWQTFQPLTQDDIPKGT